MTTDTPVTTEVETTVTPEQQQANEAAEALAGFNSVEEPTKVTVSTPVEKAPVVETPTEVATEVITEPVETTPEPETVTLTKAEWTAAQAQLARIDELARATTLTATNMNGKFGEFTQALRDLKASQGGRKLTVEQFADIAEDYPDIVNGIVKGLNTGLPEPTAAPTTPAAPAIDPEQIRKEAQEIARAEARMAAFEDKHPDWQEVRSDAKFKAWVASHDAPTQHSILNSNDVKYVGDVLTSFKNHLAKANAPAPAPAKPAARLAAAITPTGAPPAGRSPKSERDEMQKGFDSVH